VKLFNLFNLFYLIAIIITNVAQNATFGNKKTTKVLEHLSCYICKTVSLKIRLAVVTIEFTYAVQSNE